MTYQKYADRTVAANPAEQERQLLASLGATSTVQMQVQAGSKPTAAATPQTKHVQQNAVSGAKGLTSSVEEKAFSLLVSGIAAEQVAAA